jgi:hypothetical protein
MEPVYVNFADIKCPKATPSIFITVVVVKNRNNIKTACPIKLPTITARPTAQVSRREGTVGNRVLTRLLSSPRFPSPPTRQSRATATVPRRPATPPPSAALAACQRSRLSPSAPSASGSSGRSRGARERACVGSAPARACVRVCECASERARQRDCKGPALCVGR